MLEAVQDQVSLDVWKSHVPGELDLTRGMTSSGKWVQYKDGRAMEMNAQFGVSPKRANFNRCAAHGSQMWCGIQ